MVLFALMVSFVTEMDSSVPEFEELMLCGYCKQKFNDTDQSPKLLSCKHYFCLQCMRTSLAKGQELYCVYCWKCTDIGISSCSSRNVRVIGESGMFSGELGPDSLPTYNPVLCLAKNFAQMNVSGSGGGGVSGKVPDKNSSSVGAASKVVSENCHTHAMPLALWCHTCRAPVCRACATTADHQAHQVKSQAEAREQIVAELQVCQ